ncbi:Gryzun, putative trafficking through golgi-domain-containing protein [Fimicolochytrium jonesii]|uniref:Gryzun, putative trafficking through golgi-domain-containing protein n=1 Tax=Fimicolochytrium jonesii TaxID=1396493 RepID=UPI0022FDBD3B|nr:Gryzun, putative trafficking through golgi-domain-containing protein [Fimicolochytrium jonesii]KAI8820769.1 Gryzun, putative trafficking through golgi-domain-containing protein [Fimicolochytrium jonesii]
MESYPLEYVLHHMPLMAVLGLLEDHPASDTQTPQDPRTGGNLKNSLLSTLMARNNTSIWDAAAKKDAAFFHVTVLDKTHVFPPRKPVRPPVPQQHSPLSPLTPDSLLYPEGIMHPSWVQRHKETRPSVVVAFYELWERQGAIDSQDPLGAQQALSLEREKDLLLCSEITEKKRNAGERGIRFAVTIILNTSALDDSHVEDRLSFIRRTCSLDQRSSFFSSFSRSHHIVLQAFTEGSSLQKALTDQAASYYRDHDKRVRKKKAKLPPISANRSNFASSSTGSLSPVAQGSQSKPLPPAGWHLRYEFKLGVFAEFRQDVENALKHYDTTYQLLIELMNASVASGGLVFGNEFLQPHSARWTEARTLLDCLSLKMCKLQLYSNRPIPAWKQMERHIGNCRSFPEFIGPPTLGTRPISPSTARLRAMVAGGSLEFWTWAAIQYRIFGELIELATGKSGLRLPFPPSGALTVNAADSAQTYALLNSLSVSDNTPIHFGPMSATNPSILVQHAGYYYFMAAACAEERWNAFGKSEAATLTAPPPPPSAATAPVRRMSQTRTGSFSDSLTSPFSPSLQPPPSNFSDSSNSQHGVDLATLVIELLTKSYEQFKKHRAGRMTLFLASEIARVYEMSGKYDMALKFFERIGKTYRKDQWPSILKDVLRRTAQCARTLGRWEIVAECLIELLSDRISTPGPAGASEREAVLQELFSVLQQGETLGKSNRVAVDMDQIESFLRCTVQFRKHSTYVGAPAAFQVSLIAASSTSPPVPVRFARIRVAFSDPRFDHVIVDSGASEHQATGSVLWQDCTDCQLTGLDNEEVWTKQAALNFQPGTTKVLEGVITPGEGMDLKITSVIVTLESGDGQLNLDYKVGSRAEDTVTRRRWYTVDASVANGGRWIMLDGSGEQSVLRVTRRQPNISVQLKHAPPGFIDEIYPVIVEIVNDESEDIEAYFDVEFRSSGADGTDPTSNIAQDVRDESEQGEAHPLDGPNALNLIYLGIIPASSRVSRHFKLRCSHQPGERVMYNIVNYRSLPSFKSPTTAALPEKPTPASHPALFFRKSEPVRLPFIAPFTAKFSQQQEYGAPFESGEGGLFSLTPMDQDVASVQRHIVMASISSAGPWELEVGELRFPSVDEEVSVIFAIAQLESCADGSYLWKPGHTSVVSYRVVMTIDPVPPVQPIPGGEFLIQWRRKSSADGDKPWVTTSVSAPELRIDQDPIRICIDVPPLILHTTPFTVSYVIYNTSISISHVLLTMDVVEGFVVSGYKQTQIRLLPLSSMVVTYNCVALVCGKVCLPRLKATILDERQDDAASKAGAPPTGQFVNNLSVRGGANSGSLAANDDLFVFVRPSHSVLVGGALGTHL